MNIQKMCATTDTITSWNEIDFKKAKKSVKKLQKRIAVAYRNHRYDVVMYLQNRLIHSYYAKALAVKYVTSTKGKNTPGIDNVLWNTDELKFEAISSLNRRGYVPKSLKRIYIPKSNGKKRPLSIPTMKDRAIQTLFRFALEPIAEITADVNSYAYRKNRGAKNAILECVHIMERNPDLKWAIKMDVKSCFDNINHEWLLEHIFMDKVILKKMIKSPYVDKYMRYDSVKGIPQGGSLSSILCNMTLDGIEGILQDKYGSNLHFVRYADDMLVFVSYCPFLVQEVPLVIQDFLSQRGLS